MVTISRAAAILGVSEVALRHWTDQGKIEAFITPGGHRRYSESDLKKFMSTRKTIDKKDLIARIEATGKLHSEIGRTSLANRNWYNRLRDDQKLRFAHLGREMLTVIINHLDERMAMEETLEGARSVGRSFGETLASLELPLLDSVETFVLHRDPIMTAISHLMGNCNSRGENIAEAIPSTARILDEALLSLVAAHQRADSTVSDT